VLINYIKWAREIRKFHVTVLQRRLQKSVMQVQSCCFANINLLLFCRSRCRGRRRCSVSSLLLWSKKFASIVTWHHTSPLYWISCTVSVILERCPPCSKKNDWRIAMTTLSISVSWTGCLLFYRELPVSGNSLSG